MTTIACSLKEMAGDSRVTWEGIGTDACSAIKVFAANGCLYGLQGEDCVGQMRALEWLQAGAILANRPEPPRDANWHILELGPKGIAVYDTWLAREALLQPCIAIGSGRKVAYYAMTVLGMTPAEAVAEACKVDIHSGPPIYMAQLRDLSIKRWSPPKKRKGR